MVSTNKNIKEKTMLKQIGEKYFIKKEKKSGGTNKVWRVKVQCDCGTIKDMNWHSFNSGATVSCGCLSRKKASERLTKSNTKYKNTKHPLYNTFKSMKRRSHIGNGCIPEWMDYNVFYKWAIQYWFEKSVLRVKDNSMPFGPDNCYFESKSNIGKENSNKGLEKRKQTCIEKFGVDNYLKTKEGKEKLSKSRKGKGITHGKSKTKIWNMWRRMINKCTNPKYHRYEEGTTYFEEWNDFNKFEQWSLENGYQPELKFERKDISKGFYPENCIFLTPSLARKKYEDKAIETNRRKFGKDYPSQNSDVRQKQLQTMIDKYGHPYRKSGSGHQNEIQEFLSELGYEFKPNVDVLSGKEIDLYNSDLNLGIEYCGLYWHTELSPEPRNRKYHYNKYQQCKDNNVELITIYSDEWLKRKNQVKSFLRAKLGVYDTRIYARECIVKEISKDIANTFIDQYHIQGCKNSLVYFGLYYNDVLVGCMSLAKHHRTNNDLVLDRLCFHSGYQIVGGSAKLLNACKSWAKSDYEKIITWSDNRWGSGDVYSRLGFVLDKELGPDYSYVNMKSGAKRRSKQSMKKSKINCPEDKTEVEYCLELGYARIWDCGKKRWIISL